MDSSVYASPLCTNGQPRPSEKVSDFTLLVERHMGAKHTNGQITGCTLGVTVPDTSGQREAKEGQIQTIFLEIQAAFSMYQVSRNPFESEKSTIHNFPMAIGVNTS